MRTENEGSEDGQSGERERKIGGVRTENRGSENCKSRE